MINLNALLYNPKCRDLLKWPSCDLLLGFDAFGDVMKPQGGVQQTGSNGKLIQGDLDSSLASLAGNLNMNGAGYQVKKYVHIQVSCP